MTAKHLFILLLALFASAAAQSDDELHIPVENDNQFPPDIQSESDVGEIEGSGAGFIDEPLIVTTETLAPLLEEVQATIGSLKSLSEPLATVDEHVCPKPCVCNIEGDSDHYVVDCSGYELSELPKPLDTKTTVLNLQNNKLTEISKDISVLKNLRTLNVNDNEIMEIIPGSISELPELVSLKIGNNRLIEYPQDLKNSFGLTKLEELDLGGNDMRSDLKSETFSNFKALRTLTIPTSSSDLIQDLCVSLKDSLETVCTGSCTTKSFDCPDATTQTLDSLDGLLDFALPGFIALSSGTDENADPAVAVDTNIKTSSETVASTPVVPVDTSSTDENAKSEGEFSLRTAVNKAPTVDATSTDVSNSPTETNKADADVAIGATTQEKKGGVDKSVIGVIVAGMVLVVAGITIKKNWSSIKNRFNSSPRAANERNDTNANGTSPEEVPLQEKEKSPV